MPVRSVLVSFALVVVGSLSGCLDLLVPAPSSSATGTSATAMTPADEPLLYTMLGAGDYRGATFVNINATPYVSALDGTLIRIFVSQDAAAAYQAITPAATVDTGPAFPVGGIVVREASDAVGKVVAVTTVVKREAGYFPEVGDLFFGMLDPSGKPVVVDGETQWGKLQTCAACHQPRQSMGYLFGVATANRH